jgi:hypothetical protein
LPAGGPLSITNPYLEDDADVYLIAGSVLNLNHAATDTIRTFYIDGVAQAIGTWGAIGSSATNQLALITGSGLLNVTTLPPPPGVPGDYNDDGTVDAADYVVWRKHENTNTVLPNDPEGGVIDIDQFNIWRENFGMTEGAGGGSNASAAVPEPAAATLAIFAGCVLAVAAGQRRCGV